MVRNKKLFRIFLAIKRRSVEMAKFSGNGLPLGKESHQKNFGFNFVSYSCISELFENTTRTIVLSTKWIVKEKIKFTHFSRLNEDKWKNNWIVGIIDEKQQFYSI